MVFGILTLIDLLFVVVISCSSRALRWSVCCSVSLRRIAADLARVLNLLVLIVIAVVRVMLLICVVLSAVLNVLVRDMVAFLL